MFSVSEKITTHVGINGKTIYKTYVTNITLYIVPS